MYRGGQLRDILQVSEVGVTTIEQFRHLGPFTHPLSSSPSVDHGVNGHCACVEPFNFFCNFHGDRPKGQDGGQQCWRCNGAHNPQVCRFKAEICHNCSMRGHIRSVCRNINKQKVREESQIDFALGNVSCTFGEVGVLHKNVSQILAIINFFKQRNYWRNLVSKEEYYRRHNFKPNKSFQLGQIWHRQLHS